MSLDELGRTDLTMLNFTKNSVFFYLLKIYCFVFDEDLNIFFIINGVYFLLILFSISYFNWEVFHYLL